jgi:hypothetical protein
MAMARRLCGVLVARPEGDARQTLPGVWLMTGKFSAFNPALKEPF